MEASRELYIALANIKMNPEDNVDFEHALTLLEQRRFLEAIEAFPDVVAIAPELTGAYGNRGLAYLNLGLEEEAIRDFERVLELDPEDAMGYAMLAEISRFRGAPEETLRLVVEALELDKNEPQSYYIRGWLFAKAGQYEEAAEDLARFLELIDDNEDVAALYKACMVLADPHPCDEFGQELDSQEKVDLFLGRLGWCFTIAPDPDYEEHGLPCLYAHCIRNCPPLSPETPGGCPVFGYACPGDCEQVAWCAEHPRFFE